MTLRSPSDMGRKEPGVPTTAHRVTAYWDQTADFGAYLKEVRNRKGLTTRQAAEAFGVSQAYITKLENHQRKQPPGEALIRRVSDVYGLDFREVMDRAGYRLDIPRSLELKMDIDNAFRRLMGDLRFRPSGHQPDDERFYSAVVKQHIVDLALNVARIVRDENLDLEDWLRRVGDE